MFRIKNTLKKLNLNLKNIISYHFILKKLKK
jgi:hypothetical protein